MDPRLIAASVIGVAVVVLIFAIFIYTLGFCWLPKGTPAAMGKMRKAEYLGGLDMFLMQNPEYHDVTVQREIAGVGIGTLLAGLSLAAIAGGTTVMYFGKIPFL